MKLSSKKLVLDNVYSYDITSCHYTILKNLGFDVSAIDKDNKFERNKTIGIMMKNYSGLSEILRSTVYEIVDEYLKKNEISEEDIVTIQYDGFLVKKSLQLFKNESFPMELKAFYNNVILSFDRIMYIAKGKNETIVKGMSSDYKEIMYFYDKLLSLNFLNRYSVFKGLDLIKKDFFECKDVSKFIISTSEDSFYLYLKNFGQVEISKNLLDSSEFDDNDIDKSWYFETFMIPFCRSICYDFLGFKQVNI
jgi:hypothetical protein